MPKQKYRKDDESSLSGKHTLSTSLLEFIGSYASDILDPISVMHLPPLEFWTKCFEKQNDFEGKRQVKESIIWPYVDRLVYLARKFKHLQQDEQAYVLKARKGEVYWRGDDIGQFKKIVDATLDYRDLTAEEKKSYQRNMMKICTSFSKMYEQA